MFRLASFFRVVRLREVLLMLGFPLAGCVFAFCGSRDRLTWEFPWFGAAMGLLFLSIYSFNAYCGKSRDETNPRLHFLADLSTSFFLRLTAVFFLTAIVALAFLHTWLAVAGVFSFSAWAWYSVPTGLKGRPPLGTAVHFVTQVLHFVMGWSIVAHLEPKAFFIAVYTALLFSAGHLLHELIDLDADRAAGIQTLPVRIGAVRSRIVSTSVILLSGVYWVVLYADGIVEGSEFFPFFGAFLAHIMTLGLMAIKGKLGEPVQALRLRALYRTYYLAAGLVFFAIRLIIHA